MNGCWQALTAGLMTLIILAGTLFYAGNSAPVPTMTSPTVTPPAVCRVSARGGTTTSPIDPAPVRSSVGEGHILTGVVRSTEGCAPVVNAKIIFWLANPDGRYDEDHRATVFTDEQGAYTFESNFPGEYENVRPHIHLYVEAEGYRAIETEYLPERGQTEGIFDITLRPD
jgi:protocatechuate 3,4-dioxygenase beta subunit